MHSNEQFLKSASNALAQDMCASSPHQMSIKEILTHKADDLRAEALRLEMLAAQYREGYMQQDAESTLRHLVAVGLSR